MGITTLPDETVDKKRPFFYSSDRTQATRDNPLAAGYPSASTMNRGRVVLESWIQETEFYSDITGTSAVYFPFNIGRTSSALSDRDMAQLSWAAEVGNEEIFDRTIHEIDWRIRKPDHFVQAIQLALSIGAHLSAKWLVIEGTQRFPAHNILKKMANVLLPAKALMTNKPPNPSLQLNRDWFDKFRNQYYGQWVAIKDGNFLGSAKSLKELKEVVPNYREATLAQINW